MPLIPTTYPYSGFGGTTELQVYRLLQQNYMLLQRVAAALAVDFQTMEKQMSELDDTITQLQADVASLTTVDAGAVTLLNGIAAEIAAAVAAAGAAGATPEQLAGLSALHATLQAQTSSLAEAVAANTPAAPPAPPPAP